MHTYAHLWVQNKHMNPYDKLEHEHRAWSVKEAADFLGYSVSHLRRLMREGKMDECWMKAQEDGRPRFCPAKLKIWMEKRSKGNANRKPHAANKGAVESAEKEGDGKAPYSSSPPTQAD